VAVASPASSFPDVILLDINMPAYDGWDFLHEYTRVACPRVKAYLTKPLTFTSLNQIGR
jgi:CheY-like chemotaxis protein